MKKITRDMTFNQAIEINPNAPDILMDCGLACASCPIAQFETIEQGCEVHDLDVNQILEKLNKK